MNSIQRLDADKTDCTQRFTQIEAYITRSKEAALNQKAIEGSMYKTIKQSHSTIAKIFLDSFHFVSLAVFTQKVHALDISSILNSFYLMGFLCFHDERLRL